MFPDLRWGSFFEGIPVFLGPALRWDLRTVEDALEEVFSSSSMYMREGEGGALTENANRAGKHNAGAGLAGGERALLKGRS